jgi:hypothetical protein
MLVSDENINFINLFSRHPSPSRHILAVDDLIGNLSISDILHSNKTTTFKSLNISVRVDRVVGFALRFTDSIYFIFRRRTGHREDNGRQVREGHRRLHQWPRAGLGLLGRAVVSGAGDQHALVHPLKERYSCRPTWGGGVVGSTPQLGIWKFKNNESQRARVAKWRAASRRESAPDEKCTPPNRSPPPQLIPPQTTPPPDTHHAQWSTGVNRARFNSFCTDSSFRRWNSRERGRLSCKGSASNRPSSSAAMGC